MVLAPAGFPFESTRAVSGTFTVAPCAIHTVGVINDKSSCDEVPSSVACTCCALEYEAGANFAVSVMTFADSTVMKVDARPLWSVSTVQLAVPAHAENATAGDDVNCTLAPATGVTPSAATAITVNGDAACPPTGVAGFVPEIIRSVSPDPAPTVSTPLMTELPPLFTSPSCTS